MNWLKERREELGLSQDGLARELQLEGIEVTRGAIGHWEKGRYEPPLNNESFRRALGKVLNLKPAEILRRAGYEVNYGKHSDKAERAAHLIDKMKPEDQDKALRVLEALSS